MVWPSAASKPSTAVTAAACTIAPIAKAHRAHVHKAGDLRGSLTAWAAPWITDRMSGGERFRPVPSPNVSPVPIGSQALGSRCVNDVLL